MADNGEAITARRGFLQLLTSKTALRRALKVSAIVGTLLVLINQGDVLLAGMMPALWKVLLTYAVPFGVSSYSTAALLYDQNRSPSP